VNIGESEESPAGEGGFVVFFDVGDEPGTAVVAALDPDAAFDFDECARGDMGEVDAPFALGVELKFADEFGAVEDAPEEFEAAFELGGFAAVAEAVARDRHALAWRVNRGGVA